MLIAPKMVGNGRETRLSFNLILHWFINTPIKLYEYTNDPDNMHWYMQGYIIQLIKLNEV